MDFELSIFYSVFVFFWLVYLWDTYLSYRQRRIYETITERPDEVKNIMNEETFTKARLYALDNSRFGFWHSIYSQVEFSIFLWYDIIPMLWMFCLTKMKEFGYEDYEIPQSLMFLVCASLYSTIVGIPWDLYKTFVIEERHGFNKQTIGFFVKDRIKKILVTLLILLPIMSALIYIIKVGGPHFYVYAWSFTCVVTIFMMFIYPEIIAPLFDRYEPLPDGKLKTAIEELASSIEFPLRKLYVVEGSRRSAHSNAYFYGFWKNKRIVLFDTLIEGFVFPSKTTPKEPEQAGDNDESSNEEKKEEEKPKKGCNDDEILAVLGHELGHWKMNHVNFNLLISQVNIFLMFFVLGQLLNIDVLYSSFGFPTGTAPVIVRMMIAFQFIFSPYNEILGFCMIILSRIFEFQADAFAVKLRRGNELKSALMKLTTDNLSFPVHDWLFSTFHFSHPPLLERIRGIDDEMKRTE